MCYSIHLFNLSSNASINRTGGDLNIWSNGIDMEFSTNNGGTNALALDTSHNATFAGDVNIATASATSSGKLTVQSRGAQGSDQTALVLRNYSAGNYTGRVTTEYEVGTVNIAEL